jgi:cephalosporin-C deacetylase
MSIEELKVYNGVNPCPLDIDDFWDNALIEMKSVTPNVELVKANFHTPFADCFDLYFTGVGSARIHAKYLRPLGSGKFPCVLLFHGYTGNSGDWSDKLAYLNMGMAVAALDCRGQGGSSEDNECVKGHTYKGHIIRGLSEGPEKLLFRKIFLDTAQLADIVAGFEEIDENKLSAMGRSQGGGLAVACAALSPLIKKIVPVYPFLCDYKRVWDMGLDKAAYDELRDYFRHFDPQHRDEDKFFMTLGYIDIQNIAHRVCADVLWGIGMRDEICPPSTQFAVYNKILSNKEMRIYPDFGHENFPGFADVAYQFIAGSANA